MIIDRGGEFIVLVYLLACLGAIVAFLLVVFAIGWIVDRLRARCRRRRSHPGDDGGS
jgi:uncharacterized membrane protein